MEVKEIHWDMEVWKIIFLFSWVILGSISVFQVYPLSHNHGFTGKLPTEFHSSWRHPGLKTSMGCGGGEEYPSGFMA